MGDKEGAKEVLNEILGKILFKNAGQTELIRARLLELAVEELIRLVEGEQTNVRKILLKPEITKRQSCAAIK
ncbi:MAG: hypothetical protein V3V90_05940 [Thermodesulfobacteriota bacterium]